MSYDKEAKNLLLGKTCSNCAYSRTWQAGHTTCDRRESKRVKPESTCSDWTHEIDWVPMTAKEVMEREG